MAVAAAVFALALRRLLWWLSRKREKKPLRTFPLKNILQGTTSSYTHTRF